MAELSKTAWIKKVGAGIYEHMKEGLGLGKAHPKHIETEKLKKVQKSVKISSFFQNLRNASEIFTSVLENTSKTHKTKINK